MTFFVVCRIVVARSAFECVASPAKNIRTFDHSETITSIGIHNVNKENNFPSFKQVNIAFFVVCRILVEFTLYTMHLKESSR